MDLLNIKKKHRRQEMREHLFSVHVIDMQRVIPAEIKGVEKHEELKRQSKRLRATQMNLA